ncbi:MAG: tetratricopeptide repeat protein [Myxococcota bacterium]
MKRYFFIIIFLSVPFINLSAGKAHQVEAVRDMRVSVLQGVKQIFSGNLKEGGNYFVKALKIHKSPEIHTLFLLTSRLMNKEKSALQLCSNSPELSKGEHTFHYWCARVYWENGYKTKGYKSLQTAINLAGNLPTYLSTGTFMAFKLGKNVQARKMFTQLVSKDPWLLYSWLFPTNRVGILFTIEKLFANYNFKGRLYFNLAVLAWKSKYPDLTDYFVDKAAKQFNTPKDYIYELKFRTIRTLGDKKLTKKFLSQALQLFPENIHLNVVKASLLEEKKDYNGAIRILKKMMNLSPNSALILTNLGYLYLEKGKFKKAKSLLDYARVQEDPPPRLYYSLGLLKQRKGKLDDALNYFKKAFSMKPSSERYLSSLVSIMQLGKDKSRVKKFRKILSKTRKYNQNKKSIIEKRSKRINSLLEIKNRIILGKKSKKPAKCGLQCRILQRYKKFKTGKKVNFNRYLAKFASPKLLSSELPLNVWSKTYKITPKVPLFYYTFFYCNLPSLFD